MILLDLRSIARRFGLKGPGAGAWLEAHGIEVPGEPNRWRLVSKPGAQEPLLIARLGASEYFLEQGGAGAELAALERALEAMPPGVYPVLREDWALELSGAGVYAVLAQVSSIDFARLEVAARPVVMTLMIGIAVLLLAHGTPAAPVVRIWCDPTYGPALIEHLTTVVTESGGRIQAAEQTWGETV